MVSDIVGIIEVVLIAITAELEKQRWMFQAENHGAGS